MLEFMKAYISDEYVYEDYLALQFEVDSPEEVWNNAIKIFISRINSRYFYAIDKLMKDEKPEGMLTYGFAIVTLQCSLIDTFAKFRYGPEKTKNSERFIAFLEEYLVPEGKKEKLAQRVYQDIRCGLVHSGSTANNSGLSCHLPQLVTVLEKGNKKGPISLDLIVLDKMLREYFNQYVNNLKDKECKLRKNFVHTMDEVCKA